jgi:hypothetical protein
VKDRTVRRKPTGLFEVPGDVILPVKKLQEISTALFFLRTYRFYADMKHRILLIDDSVIRQQVQRKQIV